MESYYRLVGESLLNKLQQVRQFIKKHNPTIGLLTEEIPREFLKEHLPNSVSVEQGFVMDEKGNISKQCDILIYDSHNFAPLYRINDVVIIPSVSLIAIIEVKTSMTKEIFHDTINYFKSVSKFKFKSSATTYLFMYSSPTINSYTNYFHSYQHTGDYKQFDFDTFQYLPDEIIGLKRSFHLKKALVTYNSDMYGYDSWFMADAEGSEISALQTFFISVYDNIQEYKKKLGIQGTTLESPKLPEGTELTSITAIELFST